MKNVLIDLSKLKHLYTGLGSVSFYQLKYFLEAEKDFNDLKLSFFVPKNFSFVKSFNKLIVSDLYKFIPYPKKFDICYWNNQDTKYKFRAEKYVLTVHDLNVLWEKQGKKRQRRLRKIFSKIEKAEVVTFISNFTRKVVNEHFDLSSKKQYVIYNGVEVNKQQIKEVKLPFEGKYLFSIGGVREKKNFMVLVDFMAELKDFFLVIAGDKNTAYAKQMQEHIEKRGLQDRIFLIGIVSEAEKNFLYKNSFAFVYPSLYEGFGLPVIEAMLWKKPVFCSDKTSLPEIAGDFAFYWENFDPIYMKNVFEDGINTFFKDENFKNSMLKFASRYSWKENVRQYLEIFKHL